MKPRVNLIAFPRALQPMLALETYLHSTNLGAPLLHLVKIRASQINGCAYCIDMHTKDARAAGETEQRIYALDAWHETPFYDARERAALAWTEAVTNVKDGHVPDEAFAAVREQFSETDLLDLTVAVATINSWNRLSIALRAVPGTYQPKPRAVESHAR